MEPQPSRRECDEGTAMSGPPPRFLLLHRQTVPPRTQTSTKKGGTRYQETGSPTPGAPRRRLCCRPEKPVHTEGGAQQRSWRGNQNGHTHS